MGEIIRYSNGKIFVPQDEAERAKSVGCLQYFQRSRPGELKRVGKDFCLKDHDSCKMSENGKWVWYTRGAGGNDAISFLMKIEGMTFQEACLEILNGVAKDMPMTATKVERDARTFIMPNKDANTDIVRNYLVNKRGIDEEVVDYFLSTGDIYQELEHKSVCFIGKDKQGVPRIANIRGTSTSFQQTVAGSDRRYGFKQIYSDKASMHLFEAPIDLLSYLTLIKDSGLNFHNFNMLSLSGVYATPQDIKNAKKPIGLEQFLADYPNIKEIYVHFDNDAAGISAAKAIKYLYSDYKVEIEHPPQGFKDVNDYIRDINQHSLSQNKKNYNYEMGK